MNPQPSQRKNLVSQSGTIRTAPLTLLGIYSHDSDVTHPVRSRRGRLRKLDLKLGLVQVNLSEYQTE